MNILVTGTHGFVGKNLVAALQSIRDGKDRTRPELDVQEIYEYGGDDSPGQLAAYAESADFVFHLAGVNRPKTAEEYLPGNTGPLKALLAALQSAGNRCPVMLASSAQASLVGRYAGSEYGKAKLACEKLLRAYAAETGAEALIYRSPTYSASGAARITIPPWPRSATILPTTCRSRSTTRQRSWSWSTSTILCRSC